ncbi:MAG: hypothetical protein WKF30_12025 [Pyrinomonadaceae bacterium]
MSRTALAPKQRRRMGIVWVLVMAVVIVALMATEQIALLYVLATLGVSALLVIVALADLRGSQRKASNLPPADDAAAIGSGINSSFSRER